MLDRHPREANLAPFAQIAQSVEQGIENPRVGGSIPSLGTDFSLFPGPSGALAGKAAGGVLDAWVEAAPALTTANIVDLEARPPARW